MHRETVLLPAGRKFRPHNSKRAEKKESSRINLQPKFGRSHKVLFSSLLHYESTKTLEFSQILKRFWFKKNVCLQRGLNALFLEAKKS
jgi:hypothetical protein